MTKANWKEAPHDAETYEEINGERRFCKPGKYWSFVEWRNKSKPENWTILEHRPLIIEWEDMKEGMVVRCVGSKGVRYAKGYEYSVRKDDSGNLGPVSDYGSTTIRPHLYTFELVSEPERKTVKDAVEYYNGVWPCEDKNEIWHTDIISPDITHNYPVCTREEFEAEARRLDPRNWDVLIDSPEGEDEEWTHTYNEENCYIKYNEPDRHGYVIIVLESEGYDVALPENLKPIKPTITKDQFELLEKARQYFDIDPKDFAKFMNDYEVK